MEAGKWLGYHAVVYTVASWRKGRRQAALEISLCAHPSPKSHSGKHSGLAVDNAAIDHAVGVSPHRKAAGVTKL